MSSWNPGSGPGGGNDETMGLLIVVAVALVAVPALLPSFAAGITHWLLTNRVLVPAHEALFALPGIPAGPDMRRLLIAALLILGTVLAIRATRRTPRND